MKKIFVMLALTMGVVSANAQSVDSTAVTNTVAGDVTLTTDIYPQQEDGDIYHGLTKLPPNFWIAISISQSTSPMPSDMRS